MQEPDRLKSFHTAAQLLPERLWRAAYSLNEEQRAQCEELRIRLDRPLAATVAGRTVLLGEGILPQRAELEEVLARATEASVHSYLEQLRRGFLTTKHGHRLGICSHAPDGASRVLRGLSSVNIRVARQIGGLGGELTLCGPEGFRNTLILGAPGAGKTTLLRELCRRLSADMRVAVADERYEIAACADGAPRFHVGSCDVLSGGKKSETISMLLRAMSPQILATDEITEEEDCRALLSCAGCGCGLLATAHCGGPEDLRRRPVYRQLLDSGVFRQAVIVTREKGVRSYRLTALSAEG